MALNRVGEFSIRLGVSVSLDQASNSFAEKLDVIKRVISLNPLVKVRVECDLLNVFRVAKLNECLTSSVVAVEDLLQNVEDGVGRSVCLVVLLEVGLLNFGLGGQSLSLSLSLVQLVVMSSPVWV